MQKESTKLSVHSARNLPERLADFPERYAAPFTFGRREYVARSRTAK